MIPKGFLAEWSGIVPWMEPRQIEQDLIITMALIKLYSNPLLKESFAFRGGTALNKLIFNPAARYSEDIDLVQITGQPIGPLMDSIREVMDPWMGKPKRDSSEGLVTLTYRTMSEDQFPLKLKLEINTREHFSVLGFQDVPFSSTSSYYPGEAIIKSYKIEELLGTKLRALYQRRKGRDLYDLHIALTTVPDLNIDDILLCFSRYTIQQSSQKITKQLFIDNIEKKLKITEFREDIIPLLPRSSRPFDPDAAYELIRVQLLEKL